MELTPAQIILSGLQLLFNILSWDIKVHNFFSDAQNFLQTLLVFLCTKWKVWTNMKTKITETQNQQLCFNESSNGDQLCNAELKLVMDNLGILCDTDGDHNFSTVEFSALFEVEPSLEEVREAFDVFDKNRDGFIDEIELQRVLHSLGLPEGSEVEECRKMISAFDENGDGLIDFNEFVKIMEKCLC